jgi:hypothetical protein
MLRVAVDVEFLKVKGTILARSVAFVPVYSSSRGGRKGRFDAKGQDPLLTLPRVLQLNTPCTMTLAEKLPCGFAAGNLLTQLTLPKYPQVAPVEDGQRRRRTPLLTVPTPQWLLQLKLIDPYALPNPFNRRVAQLLTDLKAIEGASALTEREKGSWDEILRKLKVALSTEGERTKNRHMDFCTVLETYLKSEREHHGFSVPSAGKPAFSTPFEFLESAASAVQQTHIKIESDLITRRCRGVGSINAGRHPTYKKPLVETFDSYPKFVRRLNVAVKQWQDLAPSQNESDGNSSPLFVSYGAADEKVLNRTLTSSFPEASQGDQPEVLSSGIKVEDLTRSRDFRRLIRPLLEEAEWFSCTSLRQTPSLVKAISLVATHGRGKAQEIAAEFLEGFWEPTNEGSETPAAVAVEADLPSGTRWHMDAHNPLWDAAALATLARCCELPLKHGGVKIG